MLLNPRCYMIHPLLVTMTLLLSASTSAQPFFNKAFSYEGYMGNLEPVTGPEGFLICSNVRFGLGDIDGFQFTRFDSLGSVLYTKSFSTGSLTNVMQGASLARMLSDGSFTFLFGNRIYSGYKWSLRIFNTTPIGIINWNKKLEYVNPDYSIYLTGAMEQAFEECPDGGCLITGLRKYPSSSITDTIAPMIVKLDSTGNVLWNKTYDLGVKFGWHIISHVDTAGKLLFGFHADPTWMIASENCILTRINSNGNTLWSKRVDGFEGRFTGSTLRNGNYVVSAMDSASIYLLAMDTAGVPLWGKRYALTFPLWTWGAKIIPTLDHGYILTALKPDDNGNADVFYFKVDSLGTTQWQRSYGNNNSEGLIDFVQNTDSTFTMLTHTQMITNWSVHNYLSRLDSTGLNNCISPSDGLLFEEMFTFSMIDVVLDEFASPMISQPLYIIESSVLDPVMVDTCLFPDVVGIEDLDQQDDVLIYPNPTSGIVSVRVNATIEGSMLNIFDLLGREVISTRLSSTETIIDLGTLPSGAYLYQLLTPSGKIITGRLFKE